jgi:hypothetical protein
MQINRCPKCGRKPSEIRLKSITNYSVEIECFDCGLYAGEFKTRDEAVAMWNEMTDGGTK